MNARQGTEDRADGLWSNRRITSLADGVFAIVMTLLVLGVRVPEVPEEEIADRLMLEVLYLWPQIVAYVVTFLVLGIYWIGHNAQFHYMRRVDRTAIWINIFFFMGVCIVPFTTRLVSDYPGQEVAVILYAVNLIAINLLLLLHWRYAAGAKLLNEEAGVRQVRSATRQILVGVALFAVAIGVAFLSPRASLAVILLVPVLHILPGPVHMHWSR